MVKNTWTADQLHLMQEAVIASLTTSETSMKLMEMGCIPGSKIVLKGKAPFGDPLRYYIDDEYALSLRKEEAKQIILESEAGNE